MRTRSQPESPSGFAVLEFNRGPRARRNISQAPPGPPASRPATGARSMQLHATKEEEHETDNNTRLTTVESKQSGSTRAPRRQTRAASKTIKDDETQASSSTAPLQSLHSVEIEHNAPTKGKESEGVRTRRQTRATSADTGPQPTAKGKEPTRARSTRQTRSTNSNTTKGKEPEGGQTRRQTRATLADTGHNSTAKGNMPKRARSTRQTKSKSANSATTKGKEPKGGKTRRTRTTSGDVGHGSTAKGKEPEAGRTTRKTRSTSRKISRHDPDTAPTTKLGELGESRKRRRSNEEEHPTAKRLNTGAPITPVRRRRAIDPLLGRLSQPVLRRRQLEPVGPSFLENLNVQRTLFQIPQRVAQLRALQAMETTDATDAKETTKATESMDTMEATKNMDAQKENSNVQMEQGESDMIIPADESTSQQAYPETPRRGWNVRGLLNSIPRSFSRFIPSFGGNTQEPAGEVPEAHGEVEMPTAPEAPRPSDVPEASVFREPSPENGPSEQPSRTKTPEPEPESESESESELSAADIRYRESLKEFERNLKHVRIGDRDLTWSLQPRPMHSGERNLDGTLKKTPKTSKTRSKTPSKETPKATSKATQTRPKLTPKSPSKQASTDDAKSPSKTPPKTTLEATQKTTQKTTPETTQKTAPETTQATTPQSKPAKKRKRAPSPDVIPNPPGCSYGLDLDYFYFSESDEDEVEETSQTEEAKCTSQNEEPPSKDVNAMPKSALRSTTPAAKKVRFDASPQDSPSKRHLPRATDPYTGSHFLAPGEKPYNPPSPRTDQTPTATVSYHANASPSATAPGLISASRAGPVGTPASPMSAQPTQPSAPAAAPTARPATGPASDRPAPRSPRPAPRHAPHAQPPKTPTKEDDEPLAKARSQAEKFKPKTPSGLRTASRYSSPLTRLSDIFLNQQPKPDFGDDEFGRDALWLYEQCPKGNLEKLAWPNKKSVVVAAEVEPVPRQLLTRTWNNLEADDNQTVLSQLMDVDFDDDDLVE